ncbi:MAG: dihydropteroate synthase, partial [Planctomycetota bacterium]|nr:dihydropteroate synthase [Planctomycetota bacterium]
MSGLDDSGLHWRFRAGRSLPRNKTLIMGIVNLTPDSFSTGLGSAPSPAAAAEAALRLIDEGADLIDFGAESSRPGAVGLDEAEEIRRLGDVVARFRTRSEAPVSIDTYHAGAAALALEQGADIINDITALRGGWEGEESGPMAELAARERAAVILMHMPAPPAAMAAGAAYQDVVAEVSSFLSRRAERAIRAGVARDGIWLDPGFGFGKDFANNRELLLRLGGLTGLGFPVLAGLSRKRMIHDALGLPPGERLEASLALAVAAALNGAAMVRVHDVRATARAVG